MFGKIKTYRQRQNQITIEFEQKSATVEVINPSVVHFFALIGSERRPSKAIEHLKIVPGSIDVHRASDAVVIATEKLTVWIYDECKVDIFDRAGHVLCADDRGQEAPFLRSGFRDGALQIVRDEQERDMLFQVRKKLEPETYFYGLGEKTGHLNKKGYHYRMWNTDNARPHVERFEVMYKSIPFFIALVRRQAFGIFFDNTYETVFDFGKENSDYYSFGAMGGNLDYYFIYGPSVKEVVGGYTELTGRTPLPQLWTLGYQQCRWTYAPEARLRDIAATFREKEIPCDALYLDIDYMDGFRVFTWDRERFPDPKKMIEDLGDQGYKVVTIIDPGVKKDKGYPIYDDVLKNGFCLTDRDGVPYVNRVWPGDVLFPDFSDGKVRAWWADHQRILTDDGVAGIWDDMNEPSTADGPMPDDVVFHNDGITTDHREMHNVYGHYMAKATYEGIKKATGRRPFVITRACYAGSQKYATVWTGDNQSMWEHLRMSLPMLMNLGLSGMAFCGSDVGGFGWDCSAELLARWTQVGAFTPLFRNHTRRFSRDQEPWAFGKEVEAVCRKYIQLRYRLLPYLYDIMHEGENSGLPMIRPLLLHYQDDARTYERNDEFLCGEELLIAPVVEQGAKERLVYLPAGDRWVDYWTKKSYDGGQSIVRETPLDLCPIYIREGSVVPLYPVQQYVGEKEIETLTLDVYPPGAGRTCRYRHYQDDGESFDYRNGTYNLISCEVDRPSEEPFIRVKLNDVCHHYQKGYQSIKFIINGVQASHVSLNDAAVPFEATDGKTIFTVELCGDIGIRY